MDSDDEEGVNAGKSWKGVPGSIILINVLDETCTLAHAATCLMIRQCLRTSGSQHVGVYLYGVEDKNASALSFKSVSEIFPLTQPTLDDFIKLHQTNITSVSKAKELTLSEALWQANNSFSSCKKQLSTKTIIILSNLCTPPIKDDERPTFSRVASLVDSNIDIRVINISECDNTIHPFYKLFLAEANKGKDALIPEPVSKVDDIYKSIYQQSNRHLAVARLTFEIGNGLSIGVGVFSLLKKTGYQHHKKVDLDSETNEVLTSITKTTKVNVTEEICVSSEESELSKKPLLKSELIHYQNYGGERVEFTDEEMKIIKNPFGPPMMKLLGFKPALTLGKEKWYLKTSYFLYPNEGVIEGSYTAFKALYEACKQMSVVAICVMCTRVNSKPNLVALAPCSHPFGLDTEIGFDVVFIPFAEHLRDIPMSEDETETTEAHKTIVKDILECLTFEYQPDMFENPKTQSEYRAIEAIALKDLKIEPFVDTTKQDPKKFTVLKDDLFEELFGPFGSNAVKRPVTESSNHPKRIKCDIDENILRSSVESKTVHKYTVNQLKEVLKSKDIANLPALTGLKKQDLVDLVYQHFRL